MNGWIKLFQSLLDWEWYTDVPVTKLWIHILLRANWKESRWQGEVIDKGSFVTSVSKLAIETGLTDKQVRLALNKLEKTGEIKTKRSNKSTIIYALKWAEYQCCPDEEGKQTDASRDTQKVMQTGKERATDEEYKKRRREEDKNIRTAKPTLEEVRSYCRERHNGVDADKWFDYYSSNGWKVGKNPMKDWKACVRTWERNTPKPHVTEEIVYEQPW